MKKKERYLKLEPRENLTNAISIRVTKNFYKKIVTLSKSQKVTIPALIRHIIKTSINS